MGQIHNNLLLRMTPGLVPVAMLPQVSFAQIVGQKGQNKHPLITGFVNVAVRTMDCSAPIVEHEGLKNKAD